MDGKTQTQLFDEFDSANAAVMERLKKLDEVAYVRFASVHRQFRDIQTLMDELGKLLNESVADNNSRSSEDIRANM